MNYILIMTEGKSELTLINILLNRNLLIYNKEELLYRDAYHARQLSPKLLNMIQQTPPDATITIVRVGDKMTDKIKICSKIIDTKIKKQIKVCTLPEFEILMIIHDGLYEKFKKQKSSPSEFYKSIIKTNPKQSSFVKDYFDSLSDEELRMVLYEYTLKRKRDKTYLSLYDILK